MISEESLLWQYLSPDERSLARDGQFLVDDTARHKDAEPTDFSYLVFPFAKLYEGFLKQLFKDLGIIDDRQFYSNHYRVGKALSPNIMRRLGKRSAYHEIEQRFGLALADRLWNTWKEGRNLVFHYYPHNIRALTLADAKAIIVQIVDTMEHAVVATQVLSKDMRRDSVIVW